MKNYKPPKQKEHYDTKMSGGVGATCNQVSLQREEEVAYKQQDASSSFKKANKTAARAPRKAAAFLSFRQLNALAVITVFAASGMVSAGDFAFVIFSAIYMYFLWKISFPSLHSKEPYVFDPKNKILRLYVMVGAIIGLLFPIGYIFEGIVEGDREGVKSAAPHVFLLGSQVFMEGVAFSDGFSTPIRVFVPVLYNARRIFTLMDWLMSEFSKEESEYGISARRLYLGRTLAVANMAFWCFNLFGFLLPFYFPKAFKKYYSATGHKVK